MSRSYKKTPIVNDHKRKGTKARKQSANRKLRRMNKNLDGAPSRSYHRKANESWDISDYAWYWTKEEARQRYLDGGYNSYIYIHYPTLEDWLDYWEKCARRK